MRFFLTGLLTMFLLVFLASCSNQQSESSQDFAEAAEENSATKFSKEMEYEMDVALEEKGGDDPVVKTERMVIYQGHISIEVSNYTVAESEFQKKAEQLGGYLVESSFYEQTEGTLSGVLTLRIPQDHFHEFLEEVETAGTKLLDKQVSGNDVTEEYVDLTSRLRSKRTVEERLISFMEKATDTENLLKISKELANVQEEIETIVGRQKYLQENVDYSLITVQLKEKRVQVGQIQSGGALNTWQLSKKLFVDTINLMFIASSKVVIAMVGFSPVLLPLVAIVWFWWRRRKTPGNHE